MRLVPQAERIASHAWRVNTSKWGFAENAADLAVELATFARQVAEAATRARDESTGHAAVAETLLLQAARITQLATHISQAPDPAALRAELAPLETTLTRLKDRMPTEETIAADASTLARRAAALATDALRLQAGGRDATLAAQAIHAALRSFVGDAVAIASRMTTASESLSEDAAAMAERTRALCRPHDPTSRVRIVWR